MSTLTPAPTDKSMWSKVLLRCHPDHGGDDDLFICGHAARENIDSALVRRAPYRDISRRFKVSVQALSRHFNGHLADYVQKALSKYARHSVLLCYG